MKVKELIEELGEVDPEYEVIILDGKYCEVVPIDCLTKGNLYKLESVAEHYQFCSEDCIEEEEEEDINCVCLGG